MLIISNIIIIIRRIKSSAWSLQYSIFTMKLISPSLDFVLWGKGGGRGAFVLRQNCSRGKLICCFVLELVYLTFITAATYLPIPGGDFSVNVRKNSKFLNSISVFSFTLSWGVGVCEVLFCFLTEKLPVKQFPSIKSCIWLGWSGFFCTFWLTANLSPGLLKP